MKRKTIHRQVVPELVEPVLSATITPDGGRLESTGFRLMAAKAALEEAVAAFNGEMETNPMVKIMADHAMRQLGCRGIPWIQADPDGTIVLEIYPRDEEPAQQTRKSNLPSIEDLRERALALNIDPVPFGKAKLRLQAAIHAAGGTGPLQPAPEPPKPLQPAPEPPKPEPELKPEPPKPTVATPPKVRPPVKVESFVAEIEEDDDDVALFFSGGKVEPAKPVRTAPKPPPMQDVTVFVSPGPAPSRTLPRPPMTSPATPPRFMGGRSLSQIVGNAEAEVDVDALLRTPAPHVSTDD